MAKPENPVDGAVWVDEYGVVHEWREDESEWVVQAYKLKDKEQSALMGIFGFYASLLSDMPDDIAEEFEESYDIDMEASIETAEYFMEKFGDG